jgi:hypothetical protein
MQQMGVSVPSIGFLTDRMARPESSAIAPPTWCIHGSSAKWPSS